MSYRPNMRKTATKLGLKNFLAKAPTVASDIAEDTSTNVNESPTQPGQNQSFPDGIKQLSDPAEAEVDICFVHGLTGDRESAWTASTSSGPWPKLLLPDKLPNARILTFGYDIYVVRGLGDVASFNRLIDHASNLLNDLTTDRTINGASVRPIIFVAHDIGGLVCKEAILQSRNNPEAHLKGVFDHCKGIVFMGTPHTGSWVADWSAGPARCLSLLKSTNRSLLQILETDNQFLESIQIRFLTMIRDLREADRRLEVTCFYEELPLHVIGKVVSKDSATLPGYNSIAIHANHFEMAKFASIKETGFKRVLGELMRWTCEVSAQHHRKLPSGILTEREADGHGGPAITPVDYEDANTDAGHADTDLTPERICLQIFGLSGYEHYKVAAKILMLELGIENDIKLLWTLEHGRQHSEAKELRLRLEKVHKGAVRQYLRSLSFSEIGERESTVGGTVLDASQ